MPMRVPEFRGKEHHSACFFGNLIALMDHFISACIIISCWLLWRLLLFFTINC